MKKKSIEPGIEVSWVSGANGYNTIKTGIVVTIVEPEESAYQHLNCEIKRPEVSFKEFSKFRRVLVEVLYGYYLERKKYYCPNYGVIEKYNK